MRHRALIVSVIALGVLGALAVGVAPVFTAAPPQVRALLAPPPQAPAAIRRAPGLLIAELETTEVRGVLAEGVEYQFWTFNGTVPGPMIRVREGDTIELRLKNARASTQIHSIDLHAVNGPGGGAVATQTPPGKQTVFRWKALNPGVYVYHCASPHIPTHIANGMYGLIVVDPAGGLPKVDREYYVMQGEVYTKGARGAQGLQAYDSSKAYAERPEYVVFNGRVGSLNGSDALKARVGETVRLFVGNAGPNLVSSFHVIGEIFDRVYPAGALGGPPQQNVQTTLIPAGGAVIVELRIDVPGNYLLVDHSIYRIDKGGVGTIQVTGAQVPSIFRPMTTTSDPHR